VPELLSSAILKTHLKPMNPLAPHSLSFALTFYNSSSVFGIVWGDAE